MKNKVVLLKILLLLAIFGVLIVSSSQSIDKNNEKPNNLIIGVSSASNIPLYNSQFRLRVRKNDPILRTAVFKGKEPKFPFDINSDGSYFEYNSSSIPIHVPHLQRLGTGYYRVPKLTLSAIILPIESKARLMSFAVDVCHLPSLWYLELVYCMYDGSKAYLSGLLTSYTLQDLVGAALNSMDIQTEAFNRNICYKAVSKFSDVKISKHYQSICSKMADCLSSHLFLSKNNLKTARKYEKKIQQIYANKTTLFRGMKPIPYTKNIITEILAHRRKLEILCDEKTSKLQIILKRKCNAIYKSPDKLFYVVRYFIFIFILEEFLITKGYRNPDLFKLSVGNYVDLCDLTFVKKSPYKSIIYCIKSLINIHVSNNFDYFIRIIENGWTPFSNNILEYSCTKLFTMGFVSTDVIIPKDMTREDINNLVRYKPAEPNYVQIPQVKLNDDDHILSSDSNSEYNLQTSNIQHKTTHFSKQRLTQQANQNLPIKHPTRIVDKSKENKSRIVHNNGQFKYDPSKHNKSEKFTVPAITIPVSSREEFNLQSTNDKELEDFSLSLEID